ncbi:uncharacterized protein [Oscarella lobularis]|uniref:uncharacterized protein isoform X2 n=1 Tax=Oscarella lobularis TaxID=121494 RepID=UPI0033135287
MTLHRRWVNDGSIRLYAVSLRLGHANVSTRSENGTWAVHSYPATSEEYALGSWKNLLAQYDQDVWNGSFVVRIDVGYGLSSSKFSFFRFETYGYVNLYLNNSVEFADGLYMDRHGELSFIRRTFINLRSVAAIGNLVTGQAFVREGWNLTIGNATFYRRSTIDDDAIVTATNGQESTLDFYDELVADRRGVLSVVDATMNCHSDVVQSGAMIQIGNGRMSVDGRFSFEAGELAAANGTIWFRGGFDIVGHWDKVFTNVRIRIDAPTDGIPSTLQTGFSSYSFTLGGDGLIIGRESVIVDVCETRQFHVLDPVRWLPDPSLGVVTTFINSGLLVRRDRPGTAVIYGHYVGNEESIHTTAKSLVVFRSLPEGKTATWTNREGGS